MTKNRRNYRIWLNKNLSSTVRVLENLRQTDHTKCFTLVCSHPDRHNPVSCVADSFIQEPGKSSINDQDYVEWCLNFAVRNKIDLFIPGRRQLVLAKHKKQFEEAGIQMLIPAEAPMLETIENKAWLYKHLQNSDLKTINIPAYATVTNLQQFEHEIDKLEHNGYKACFKPTIGVYGLGFHVISKEGSGLERFLSGDSITVSREEARFFLGQKPDFRELIVMEYLPGDERSIDCLAVNGELKACVSRVKSASKEYQVLEDNPNIFFQAAILTKHLGLNGLFNIQFKDDSHGQSKLLEINPRMSGGLPMACLSGFNFLYWAVKLALEPENSQLLPQPRRNLKVRDVSQPLLLSAQASG